MFEYVGILIALVVGVILASIIIVVSYVLVSRNREVDKLIAYECGFHPFGDARNRFDVKFYLVAILFIIFDLEITFLFPWVLCLGVINMFGFWAMIVFLFVLTIGFVYEWFKGALEW